MANFIEPKLRIIPQNETLEIVQYSIDRICVLRHYKFIFSLQNKYTKTK